MTDVTHDEAAFLAALETGRLRPADFRHRDHLRAAYLLLRRHPFGEAVARMSAALRQLTAAHGQPGRYHETVTLAFMTLVNERLALGGDGGGWDGFLAGNPDLLDGALLSRYYRPETLRSERARRVFVLEPLSGSAPTPQDTA